jgi:hypothetical protein
MSRGMRPATTLTNLLGSEVAALLQRRLAVFVPGTVQIFQERLAQPLSLLRAPFGLPAGASQLSVGEPLWWPDHVSVPAKSIRQPQHLG